MIQTPRVVVKGLHQADFSTDVDTPKNPDFSALFGVIHHPCVDYESRIEGVGTVPERAQSGQSGRADSVLAEMRDP